MLFLLNYIITCFVVTVLFLIIINKMPDKYKEKDNVRPACNKCTWYRGGEYGYKPIYLKKCEHPSNFKRDGVDPISGETILSTRREAEEINKNLDCKNFKRGYHG